jgi:hypothetical protein
MNTYGTLPAVQQGATAQGRDPITQQQVAVVLNHRFGDGLIYLLNAEERPILDLAMREGLVSADGFLTPSGYRLWRRLAPA